MTSATGQQSDLKHLAIIMDGNGRWAQRRALPRAAGHKAGVTAARKLIEACKIYKIEYLTLFAFSSENWSRPFPEVQALMELFLITLEREITSLIRENVRVSFIGDLSAFDAQLRNKMVNAELRTADNQGLKLNIAVNYGGRWDITQAVRRIFTTTKKDNLNPEDITAELLGQYLCLAAFPEPDLLIRTSGEYRISNFLIWQCAYSELYFTNCLWPDFDEKELEKAVLWYQGRERRFGSINNLPAESSAEDKVSHA